MMILDDFLHYTGIHYAKVMLPWGAFVLVGDNNSLKAALWSSRKDLNDFDRLVPAGITRPIQKGIKFLEEYRNGKILPPPEMDLSVYTEKERNIYHQSVLLGFGQTISYGELGERVGLSRAGRFVGNTMAKNRFPIFIPCHRVIKSDGGIGNYSSGKDIKAALLKHECSI